MEWVPLDHNVSRAKVPGGWIVKLTNVFPFMHPTTGEIYDHYGFVTESITFVPDPMARSKVPDNSWEE